MTPPRLTPAMRSALWGALAKGGLHVGTGKVDGEDAPAKCCTKQTADRLTEAGLAKLHGSTLITLKAGRLALDAPIPDVPVYLRERDGLTTQASLAVKGEAEVMECANFNRTMMSRERRDHANGRKNTARELGDLARDPLPMKRDAA